MRFTTEPAHLPQQAEQVAQVVEMVGPELLLYASDHPHEHGDGIERLLGALSDEDAEAILHGNAPAILRRIDRMKVVVCRVEDLPPGTRKIVKAGVRLIGVFNVDRRVLRHPQSLSTSGRAAVRRAPLELGCFSGTR